MCLNKIYLLINHKPKIKMPATIITLITIAKIKRGKDILRKLSDSNFPKSCKSLKTKTAPDNQKTPSMPAPNYVTEPMNIQINAAETNCRWNCNHHCYNWSSYSHIFKLLPCKKSKGSTEDDAAGCVTTWKRKSWRENQTVGWSWWLNQILNNWNNQCISTHDA